MTNVISLTGEPHPSHDEPNQALVESLERLLADARSGRLQCFLGTGFGDDGDRVSLMTTAHDNVYEMLGAIEWLRHEYIQRVENDE